jgi:hypothetical protein
MFDDSATSLKIIMSSIMRAQRANCLVSQDVPCAIVFAVPSAAAFYRASGLVLWARNGHADSIAQCPL